MDDLAAFLRAQWAAEERLALDWQRHKQARTDQYMNDPGRKNVRLRREPVTDAQVAEYAYRDRFDPDRMLAGIASKRRTLGMLADARQQLKAASREERTADVAMYVGKVSALLDVVKTLAELYEGEDGYKQEWKP